MAKAEKVLSLLEVLFLFPPYNPTCEIGPIT